MALGPISVSGGAQYQIELAFYYTGGNWWLYFNGNAAANAIGYYPGSLYGNGALRTNANEIDYGGETVGTTSFPAMGSGAFANQGYQRAAYQRTIAYYPVGRRRAQRQPHPRGGDARLVHGASRVLCRPVE